MGGKHGSPDRGSQRGSGAGGRGVRGRRAGQIFSPRPAQNEDHAPFRRDPGDPFLRHTGPPLKRSPLGPLLPLRRLAIQSGDSWSTHTLSFVEYKLLEG